MSIHYFMPVLFGLAGLTALAAAVLDWKWFFNTRNAQIVVRHMGQKKARIAYGAMGALLIVMSVYFIKAIP